MSFSYSHYFVHGCWFDDPEYILNNIDKIKGKVPGIIVQGRYDAVCPMKTAWDLHEVNKLILDTVYRVYGMHFMRIKFYILVLTIAFADVIIIFANNAVYLHIIFCILSFLLRGGQKLSFV